MALVACSSAPVPVDTFYRLEQVSDLPNSTTRPGTVEVAPLRGEGVVNARAILFRKSATELQQYSYHFWAETPASMLQRNIVDALRQSKTFENAVTPDMRADRAFEVIGTLRKLEHDQTQSPARAQIEIELGLRRVTGNVLLTSKVYQASVAVGGAGMPAVVAALSAAQSQIIAQFLADLAQIQR
jgi:ABC-type uncharacterized transport system auxiliary subunit